MENFVGLAVGGISLLTRLTEKWQCKFKQLFAAGGWVVISVDSDFQFSKMVLSFRLLLKGLDNPMSYFMLASTVLSNSLSTASVVEKVKRKSLLLM